MTVATVLEPTGTVGAKLVSYQMAYDALGAQCDPVVHDARRELRAAPNTDEEQFVLGLVAAGDTVVVPDYEGDPTRLVRGPGGGLQHA